MNNGNYKTSSLSTLSSKIKISDDILKTDVTLLKLTGDKSPFESNLSWFFDKNFCGPSPEDGVTTDYFQFIVLIKNGKATTPLGK